MMPEKTKSSPFPEDMTFQERTWLAQRIGWAMMGLFIVLALLGVFYSGVLSETRAATADGAVVVEYHRFAHRTARSHLTIRVAAPLSGDVLMRISPSFGQSYDIEVLHPHPVRNTAGTSGLEFVFARSGSGDLTVDIGARAKRFGILRIEIAVPGRGSVDIIQIIYP
jgi:hypothetical protein